jgi:hypothetical protein
MLGEKYEYISTGGGSVDNTEIYAAPVYVAAMNAL